MADLQIVPVHKSVEAQYVEMMVPLYSYGCEKKIKKALAHLKGTYSVEVDYKQQKVTVWGICNKNDVLATVRGKRKEACFWNSEDNDELTPSSPPSKISETLTPKGRPLIWKAWKKVFMRSYSFS
ncbi:Heavy metal-associated domain, HMA [Dillenia turbinata]|uniref:Heavy metal-associated domain, HMA n=1 Tax=Dillenia turbinata TaxID=194707 RepID=A0AAN8VZZ2_9MAGN